SGWGPAAGGDPRGGLTGPAPGRHAAHGGPGAAGIGPPSAVSSAPPSPLTPAPVSTGPGAAAQVSAQPPLSSPPSSAASSPPPAPATGHGHAGTGAPHGPLGTGAAGGHGTGLTEGPDGSVRLPGSPVPIGPGPRAADARSGRAAPDGGPATGWVRPPSGGPGVGHGGAPGGHPTGHAPGGHPPRDDVPHPPARAGHPAQPHGGDGEPGAGDPAAGRWRPWRFRMSNDVWGTPTVAGDLLYVTSFEVHALDTGTGRRVFRTRDVAWAMAVSGGRIHASDGTTLYALDAADGAERWRLSTEGWVYSLSVDRGTVVTGTRGGGVQAWEAANGELLWEMSGAQTDFETPESGPLIHDDTVYVWSDARLRALEARTGVERWSYPVGDAASCGGVPVRLLHAPDGVAYITAGTRVLAIDIAHGDVRWRFEAPAVFLSPPAFAPGAAVAGGGIYIADYLGTVYALDAANGRDRWRIATEPRQSVEPVLVAAGSVHLGSGGALYTLDAVTGTPKWRFAAGGEVVGAPVVAEGRVHFGSADHCLYTVDATGGQLRWKLATGGEITGSPVAVAGVVYACSKDRCVYALDAAKGTGLSRPPAARHP
ncbi:PQQ-binding-like beta-propeller repeat protein, partial [Streptomyces sp. NPDC057676]|uniref:outer membrane protein assembly factor BamB family protein n=2 Tax=unclassified Streptomyces TaxID=2593676 RepID=UPI00367FFA2C